jgi:hypothetical protein
MTTLGDIFQPVPGSRAAACPVPVVAIPPRPASPREFPALIDRLRASLSKAMFMSTGSFAVPVPGCATIRRPVPADRCPKFHHITKECRLSAPMITKTYFSM